MELTDICPCGHRIGRHVYVVADHDNPNVVGRCQGFDGGGGPCECPGISDEGMAAWTDHFDDDVTVTDTTEIREVVSGVPEYMARLEALQVALAFRQNSPFSRGTMTFNGSVDELIEDADKIHAWLTQ